MAEDEIPAFLEALRRALPQTFRFTGYKTSAEVLLSRLNENFLKYFDDLVIDGEKITKPKPIEWYPNKLAWYTN